MIRRVFAQAVRMPAQRPVAVIGGLQQQRQSIVTKVEGVRGAAAAKKAAAELQHDHDHEAEEAAAAAGGPLPASCGPENTGLDDESEMESMFVEGPAGIEWGGPTRGGQRPEPTRFGDWERKGRASDF